MTKRVTSRAIRRGGSADISFSTEKLISVSGIPLRVAKSPIVVATQLPREAAQRSVGEKVLPSPPLSFGAIVEIVDEDSCVSVVVTGDVRRPEM